MQTQTEAVPASAPEIVSRDTLEALAQVIDAVRARPASEVVRLAGMKPSPGAERIGEATGRVCVAVGDEAVLVAPAANCGRCNGSTAFRFRAMRKGESVAHPCECVSRQIRKVAPAPKFETMAERAAALGAEVPSPPPPVVSRSDEKRAHLEARLGRARADLDAAQTRMADAVGPFSANVEERYVTLRTVAAEAEAWRARAVVCEVSADAVRAEIANAEARLARLREALSGLGDKAREIAGYYDGAAKSLSDAEAAHRDAVAEREKVARRRQKDVDRAAEDVAKIEAKLARECGADDPGGHREARALGIDPVW